MRRFLFALPSAALFLTLPLAGCAAGPRWQEEVVLFDGTKVVVEREQILGSRFDRELSDITLGPPVRGNILRAPLPTGGWTLEWEAPGLDPQAIGRVGDAWYVSATPMRCDGYDKWGRPVPPYVFFKYAGNAWQRISVGEFPEKIAKRNLTYWGSGAHRSAVAGGYISAEQALKVSPGIGLPDYVNNIYRNEAILEWDDCKRRLEVLDRNKKPKVSGEGR